MAAPRHRHALQHPNADSPAPGTDADRPDFKVVSPTDAADDDVASDDTLARARTAGCDDPYGLH